MAHMLKRWGARAMLLTMVVVTALGSLVAAAGAHEGHEHDPEVTVKMSSHPSLGAILTDAKGMTLYMFTKDTDGTSVCYDICEQNWPPLLIEPGQTPVAAPGLTGTIGTTTRKDGTIQVTYDSMPLYYWIHDKQPGDTNGQGVNDVWWMVDPKPATVIVSEHPTYGAFLTDINGMTLYAFTKDTPNKSNCAGPCLDKWPPLITEGPAVPPAGLSGTLSTMTMADGQLQVTYNGMPLYYWWEDEAPGDTKGHGFNEVWYVANVNLFPDTLGHWANMDVARAVKSGWVGGYPDGYFKPDGAVTRAEFLKMLTVANGLTNATTSGSFADIAGHWSESVIESAVTAGVVMPSDYAGSMFEPDRAITREEIALFVARAAGLKDGAESSPDRFTDRGQISAAVRAQVAAAVDAGVITGYPDNTFRPQATATRGEAVVMILRALNLAR